MADVADLGVSPLEMQVYLWLRGEQVDRAAIVRALESGEQVPPMANTLLAGLLDGSIAAKPGCKPGRAASPSVRGSIANAVATYETMLSNTDTIPAEFDKETRDCLRALAMEKGFGALTSNQKARQLVAGMYGVSEAVVKQCIAEQNKQFAAIARRFGISLDDVKRALRHGQP